MSANTSTTATGGGTGARSVGTRAESGSGDVELGARDESRAGGNHDIDDTENCITNGRARRLWY